MRAKDGGALPDTGFPHVGGKAKEGQRAPIVQTRGKTRVHLIQDAFIRSRASSRGYTFEACVFERIEFVEGSRRSRVDGSGTCRRRSRVVVEVDVHGRRGSSGTRSFF